MGGWPDAPGHSLGGVAIVARRPTCFIFHQKIPLTLESPMRVCVSVKVEEGAPEPFNGTNLFAPFLGP